MRAVFLQHDPGSRPGPVGDGTWHGDERGVPVLGIGFGGQALAAAHGGTVAAAPQPESGWFPIESDDQDPIPNGPWMQWHGDRFTVPPAATELARNDVGPQAFRLRRNLAVQFHPEVDEAAIRLWIELGGDAATRALAAAGTRAERVLADARAQQSRTPVDVARLVGRFLEDVAGST
jgi:GMP synthase-like glutamine amidotransferase